MRRWTLPVHPRRHFQLIDVLVLVAATAVGFALVRWYDREGGFSLFTSELEPDRAPMLRGGPIPLATRSALLLRLVAPAVLMWTLATFVLRLRHPRPRRRRLFRQAGMAGCSAAILVPPCLLVANSIGMIRLEESQVSELGYWLADVFRQMLPWSGCSVAAVWLNLWLCGRWVAERSWIDRLGRVLSIYWIVASVITRVY